MSDQSAPPTRDPSSKLAHIEACLDDDVEYRKSAGFERFEFIHEALPELSLDAIDTSLSLRSRELGAPLMVAPMTGGVERGRDLNRKLAAMAQRHRLAMGLGSLRLAIEDPSRAELFRVRDVAPDILLFANVGAGQLSRGWGPEQCLQAVQVVDADHLLIHLNPLQEAVQKGDVDFSGLLEKIQEVAEVLAAEGITVGVREVGFGLSAATARRLIDAGITLLDCAGAGGTSWAKVEARVASDPRTRRLGEAFGEWGIPTADSVRAVRAVSDHVDIIATGGLRSGLDLAKAIALGADLGAMARPFLLAAERGDEELDTFVTSVIDELRLAMFCLGAPDLEALHRSPHLVERAR